MLQNYLIFSVQLTILFFFKFSMSIGKVYGVGIVIGRFQVITLLYNTVFYSSSSVTLFVLVKRPRDNNFQYLHIYILLICHHYESWSVVMIFVLLLAFCLRNDCYISTDNMEGFDVHHWKWISCCCCSFRKHGTGIQEGKACHCINA